EGASHDSVERRTGESMPEPLSGPVRGRRTPRSRKKGTGLAGHLALQPTRSSPPQVSERVLVPGNQPDQRPQRLECRVPDPRRNQDPPRPTLRRSAGRSPSLNPRKENQR